MRLICPKCAAQYQVPDDAIPRTGRDVQCSNCGETWYAMRDDDEFAAAATELTAPPDAEREPIADEVSEAPASRPPEPEEVGEDDRHAEPPDTTYEPDDDEEAVGSEVAAEALARRRALAPDVARILREEAEREAHARRSTAETFEDQPDLGLEPPAREPPPAPEPVEEPPAVEPEPERPHPPEPEREPDPERVETSILPTPAPVAPVAARATSRHEDLPDAGEINRSLRRTADRPPPPTEGPTEAELAERDWRRGFRLGFGIVVLIALALALIYAQAPRIAEAVPALAPGLDAYAGTIDTARFWLDLWMQNVLGGAEG